MWKNPQETADLITFINEILNGKLHFFTVITIEYFCGDLYSKYKEKLRIMIKYFRVCVTNSYSIDWVELKILQQVKFLL